MFLHRESLGSVITQKPHTEVLNVPCQRDSKHAILYIRTVLDFPFI